MFPSRTKAQNPGGDQDDWHLRSARPEESANQDELLTTREVMERYGVSRSGIHYWRRKGLKAIGSDLGGSGKQRFYRASDVEALLGNDRRREAREAIRRGRRRN